MQVLTHLLAPTARDWEPCVRDVDPVSTGAVYCSTVNCQEAPRLWKVEGENPEPICQGANHLDRLLDSDAGLTEFPGDRNRACHVCGTGNDLDTCGIHVCTPGSPMVHF